MEFPGASAANSSLTLLGRVTDLVKKGATIELQEAIQTLRETLLAEKEDKLSSVKNSRTPDFIKRI